MVNLHFPATLTEEEEQLKLKYAKLKKKVHIENVLSVTKLCRALTYSLFSAGSSSKKLIHYLSKFGHCVYNKMDYVPAFFWVKQSQAKFTSNLFMIS